jgi:hypothetical protein
MSYLLEQAAVDRTVYFMALDATGSPVTGLTSASTGIVASYLRPRGTRQAISLSDLTNPDDAHSDGGMDEVDATNMPGLYRLDLPDAAVAAGAEYVIVFVTADDMEPAVGTIDLSRLGRGVSGSVNDASATATSFVTDLAGGSDDLYNDAFLRFLPGTANPDAVRQVTDWVDSSKTITVDTLPTAPADGDEFVIVNR